MEKLPTRATHVIAEMAIAARGIPVYADSMGILGSKNGGTVPYKAIFCWDIPLHRPYIGLIYGR